MACPVNASCRLWQWQSSWRAAGTGRRSGADRRAGQSQEVKVWEISTCGNAALKPRADFTRVSAPSRIPDDPKLLLPFD